MKHILFRCDASVAMGSGHVIRCRTLGRELQRSGANVTFLCRQQCGDLISLLESEFDVIILPELPPSSRERLKGRDLYKAWLGCSQEQDASQCLEAISRAGLPAVDWLVVDHYGLDYRWETHILLGLPGLPKSRLMVIDDLADRQHIADLLLDQNFYGPNTEQRYKELVPSYCEQLLGPEYALLGPEYSNLHPLLPIRSDVKRLLVFFGGVDQDNFTSYTLEALMEPAFSNLSIDIVLGFQCPHRKIVEDLAKNRRSTTLHAPLPSLAGLIARADLAIGACGATTWERACLGCPSIVTVIAENQLELSQALRKADISYVIEGIAGTDYASCIRSAVQYFLSPSVLSRYSAMLPQLCQGRGCDMICKTILS